MQDEQFLVANSQRQDLITTPYGKQNFIFCHKDIKERVFSTTLQTHQFLKRNILNEN